MSKQSVESSLSNLEINELQKLKLKEEILLLKKPIWKQTQFISIVVTLVIAFVGTSITLWQSQNKKIELAEAEKNKYQALMDNLIVEKDILKEKSRQANMMLTEALSEKAAAISEKTEIKNQVNSLQEIQLINREKDLSRRIFLLQNMNKELEKLFKGYKEAFIETFVSKNETVQNDISRFAKDGMKLEMEDWLKKKFLFTALVRYQKYIVDKTGTAVPD